MFRWAIEKAFFTLCGKGPARGSMMGETGPRKGREKLSEQGKSRETAMVTADWQVKNQTKKRFYRV
jgi:hypothetical protein